MLPDKQTKNLQELQDDDSVQFVRYFGNPK